MPTTSQLWFITKKAALVIGVLAIAHAVAAPRNCGACVVKAGKSQASSNPNPGETNAAGGGAWGPGTTQSLPYIEKKKKNSGNTKGSEQGAIAIIKPGETTAAGGGAWGPGTTGVSKPGMNLRIDTPRVSPGGVGGGAGGGVRVR
jgi:hypothetical protein